MADQKKPENRSGNRRPGETGRRTGPDQARPRRSGTPGRPRPQSRPPLPKPVPALPVTPVEIEPPSLEPPEYVVIAQISSPFGLRGAVKAAIQTDFPDRFEQLKTVFLSPPGKSVADEREERPLLSARLQNEKQVVLRFEGVTKPEQAEALRGYTVSIPVAEVVPLPEGEYYIFQIIGLEVYSTEEQYVGTIVNVERLPANDIYLVRGPLSPKDLLLPAIKDVVKKIDLEAGRMTVELIEGLI